MQDQREEKHGEKRKRQTGLDWTKWKKYWESESALKIKGRIFRAVNQLETEKKEKKDNHHALPLVNSLRSQ